jgi:hypothetical protein
LQAIESRAMKLTEVENTHSYASTIL